MGQEEATAPAEGSMESWNLRIGKFSPLLQPLDKRNEHLTLAVQDLKIWLRDRPVCAGFAPLWQSNLE